MKKVFLIIGVLFILSMAKIGFSEELNIKIYTSNQTENFELDSVVREYAYEEFCYSTIFVGGFQKDSEDKSDLIANLKFIDPNGNVLFEEKGYAFYKSKVPEHLKFVMLNNSFDVILEKGDPLGMYTIEVEVKDNISGLINNSKVTLLIFDTQESKKLIMSPVETAKDIDDLWLEYFRSKNPWAIKRIISALRLSKESQIAEDAAVGFAAQWSLEENAKKYSDVLEICKQSLDKTRGTTNELLRKVIINVEKYNN